MIETGSSYSFSTVLIVTLTNSGWHGCYKIELIQRAEGAAGGGLR